MHKSSVVYWSSGTSLEREENKDGEGGGGERDINIKQWEHHSQGHMVLFLYLIDKLRCRTPLSVNQRIERLNC